MVGDPISNMIISIKNASMVKKETTSIPYSKMKEAILEALVRRKFVESYEVKGDTPATKKLIVTLKYTKNEPAITDLRRQSKFSRRIYKGFQDIHRVKSGHGAAILTSPVGIITDDEARKRNVGGELLFTIW